MYIFHWVGVEKGQIRTYLNLFTIFLISGIWHGAGWTFVIWGVLHGLAIVIHRLFKNLGGKMPKFIAWILTMGFVHVLKTFKTYQNECKLKLGARYDKTFDFVFTTTGKPIPKSTLKNVLDRILKNAELPQIGVHGLRHTHAVLLLEAGVEMKYIQERLGHKSIEITSNIYSHVTPKIIENEQSKYEAYVGQEFIF